VLLARVRMDRLRKRRSSAWRVRLIADLWLAKEKAPFNDC
jgi:hypothetical protein